MPISKRGDILKQLSIFLNAYFEASVR